jgi:choline kinase
MILIILASGRGSRLRSLTKNKPKCLIKIYKNKTLIDYISENFKFFKTIIVVTGHKSDLLKKNLNYNNIKFVHNKNYLKTNMVESLMLASHTIKKNDIIISYADIFFSPKIIKSLIKYKENILPLNKNWLKSWKKRYKKISYIKTDAEDLIVKNKEISHIGDKIKDKLPKYQYMGILKINNKTFYKLLQLYKNLKNKRISMTELLNTAIQKKIAKFNYFVTNKFWYEVDNLKDLKILKKEIKRFN